MDEAEVEVLTIGHPMIPRSRIGGAPHLESDDIILSPMHHLYEEEA